MRVTWILLALPCVACRSEWLAPPLAAEPWSHLEPGALGVAIKPGLFTLYGVDGDFEAETPASGTLTETDSGDLVGRFGLAVRGELALSEELVAFAGVDYRVYDIDGLNPIQDLDVTVETVDSLQYTAGLRYYLEPFERAPRLRPWCEASLSYLPGVDVGFEVDLSSFGSSNLSIETESGGYWVGGLAGGVAYRWTDRWTLDLGAVYEVPLSRMDTDLTFEIGTSEVPMFGKLRPRGIIGFFGLTWMP